MNGFVARFTPGACLLLALTACAAAPTTPAAEPLQSTDPPAYMIVLGDVYDRPAFMAGYAAKLPPLYEKYGGQYVAIGGELQLEVLEGDYSPASFVIGKWESSEHARAFWNSPEYKALKAERIDKAWGRFNVLLVQGLPETAGD